MVLASGDRRPSIGMLTGVFEEGTTRMFQSLLKPGMVAVDIGAHVGYYTILAARHVGPTGKVYAFEPDPDNYTTLLKNIALNGYRNVHAVKKAVSNLVGDAELHLSATINGNHSLYCHGMAERGTLPVETTTLDSMLCEQGWPQIDLVKIDVEGGEVAVLDGMAELLNKSPNLDLILEFMPVFLRNAGVAPRQFLDKLISLFPRVYYIDERIEPALITLDNGSSLANRLLAGEDSGNILCTSRSTGLL